MKTSSETETRLNQLSGAQVYSTRVGEGLKVKSNRIQGVFRILNSLVFFPFFGNNCFQAISSAQFFNRDEAQSDDFVERVSAHAKSDFQNITQQVWNNAKKTTQALSNAFADINERVR